MGNAFGVTNPGIKIIKVDDLQDGRYTITFGGNISDTTSLQLLGQTIYTGKLSDIGKGKTILGLPVWLFWLLLILLLLLILWLLFRKK